MINTNNKFGMQVPLNPPKIDFDLGTVTQKILVDSVENLEDAMVSEICKIAREKGVTTLILLEKQKIADALEKATAKPPKRGYEFKTIYKCPTCDHTFMYCPKYCSQCGQKIEWLDQKTNTEEKEKEND